MPVVQLAMHKVLPDRLEQDDSRIYSTVSSSDTGDKCWDQLLP